MLPWKKPDQERTWPVGLPKGQGWAGAGDGGRRGYGPSAGQGGGREMERLLTVTMMLSQCVCVCVCVCVRARVLSRPIVSDSVTPWTVACQAPCPWDSPGKNAGVGCHALLQGPFPIQGLNPGVPSCRRILYHLSQQGGYKYQNVAHVCTDWM